MYIKDLHRLTERDRLVPFVKLVNGMEYVIKSASKVCIKNIFNRIEEINLLIITTSTVPPSAVPRYGALSADATLGPDSPGSR